MDIIYIHGLKIKCAIGVWQWEKAITRTLVVDIDLATDISNAADSDSVNDTIDYKAVSDRVTEYARDHQFDLIETLIEHLANMIIKDFSVPWVKIKLDKRGAVHNVDHVGVIIERGNKPS